MEAVLNMETVEEKLARAWSTTDDRKIWNCTYAGMVIRGTRVLKVYEDEEGDTWYKTYYIDTETGELLTEEEHIFGRKLR